MPTKKASRKRPQPAQPAGGNKQSPTVRVRMYRQGLGDCFLLTFANGGEERHVLIDFGTLGTKGGVSMDEVAKDIVATTGGAIRLLIVTHEHHDHLSGFPKLAKELGTRKAETVWLAWTENQNDALAKKLKGLRLAIGVALMKNLDRLRGVDGKAAELVQGLLGFFGHSFDGQGAPTSQDGFQAAVTASMELVRTLGNRVEYREPGEPVIELPEIPGFRFYVLGPPRSADAIGDTGEKGSSQLYGLRAFAAAADRAVIDGPTDSAVPEDEYCPFDLQFRLRDTDDRIQAAFADSYFAADHAWRRVDGDWLGAASDLALKLDNLTNNTSLAIAIERVSDGKVLLFPGDAQQGNWLSWHDAAMKWTSDGAKEKKTITASDLLARTVFYKVGHHASHNATVREKGLEMMQSKELIAFIPVDRQVALSRNPKGSWKMPARQLYARLLEKCDGRVMRSDGAWAKQEKKKGPIEGEFANLGTDKDWAGWQASQTAATNVVITPRYIDYTLA